MTDRERVVKGLMDIEDEAYDRWVHQQYHEDRLVTLIKENIADALALLKEQEPIIPHIEGDREEGTWYYGCGACHEAIDPGDKFCRHCGREVDWNA